MARLRSLFHLDIGELFVRAPEVGASFSVPTEPRARIALPGGDPPFVLAVDRHGVLMERPFTGSTWGSGDEKFLGVRIVQLIVTFEADLSASEFDEPPVPVDRAMAVWDEAYDIGRAVYEAFRAWARVAGGQYWIGAGHEQPQFAGIQVLEDLDAGARIPVGYPRVEGIAAVMSAEAQAKMATVEQIVARMGTGEPPLADTLLADARAIYWPKYRTRADHQRAVLLAAIATEVKVKETLLELAAPELLPLVQVIVSNPRDVTQSVPQLLGKPLQAVSGRSLAQANNRLYLDVEKLFTLRNNVAHRGHIPSESEGRAAAMSARELFRWLDGLSAGDG